MSQRYQSIRFSDETSRWQQSTSWGDYFTLLWMDFRSLVADELDCNLLKERMIYFLENFHVKITVSCNFLITTDSFQSTQYFLRWMTLLCYLQYTLCLGERFNHCRTLRIKVKLKSQLRCLYFIYFIYFIDQIYENMFTISFAIFSFEFLANTWCKTTILSYCPLKWEGYFLSFYWFLDIISIVSLFPDVNWIGNKIGASTVSNSYSGGGNLQKAGQVVRLVRLVRLVRVYKIVTERRKRAQEEAELEQLIDMGIVSEEEVERQRALNESRSSKLGQQLSDSITQKVIIMILAMIIVLPLLTYSTTDESSQLAVDLLQTFNNANDVTAACKDTLLQTVIDSTNANNIPYHYLVRLNIFPLFSSGLAYDSGQYYSQSSTLITEWIETNMSTNATTMAYFSERILVQSTATLTIILIIFVAIMLVGGAAVFTGDAENLVLKPIERMMNMVEAVAANPLAPLSFGGDSKSLLNNRRSSTASALTMGETVVAPQQQQAGDYETKLLETTIEKITGLLRVGFGEAGAGIISANLKTTNASTAINPLLPGVRVYAIVGFCDIHHFEEINQVLGNDVLTFVNSVAEIVHSAAHGWSGQVNKNLGNAFVVVWRIGDEQALMAATMASIQSLGGGSSNRRSNHNTSSNRISGTDRDSNADSKSNDGTNSRSMRSFHSKSQAGFDRGSDRDDEKSESSGGNRSNSTGTQGIGAFRLTTQAVDLRRVPGVDVLAHGALTAYLKVIAEINRSQSVLRYRTDPRLSPYYRKAGDNQDFRVQALMPPGVMEAISRSHGKSEISAAEKQKEITKRISALFDPLPTEDGKEDSKEEKAQEIHVEKEHVKDDSIFKVRMGFGLHAGWAIEGAVGSIFKVDATYLSPHVNMAARLETASRQYGVPLLMSNCFHELLATPVQRLCRKLDVVTVKGSEQPIGLYTYDVWQDQFFVRREEKNAENRLTAKALQRMIGPRGSSTNGGVAGKSILKGRRPSASQMEMMAAKKDLSVAVPPSSITTNGAALAPAPVSSPSNGLGRRGSSGKNLAGFEMISIVTPPPEAPSPRSPTNGKPKRRISFSDEKFRTDSPVTDTFAIYKDESVDYHRASSPANAGEKFVGENPSYDQIYKSGADNAATSETNSPVKNIVKSYEKSVSANGDNVLPRNNSLQSAFAPSVARKESFRQSPRHASNSSNNSPISHAADSNKMLSRPSSSSNISGHATGTRPALPLPPLGTQHSATARLLLSQVSSFNPLFFLVSLYQLVV